MFKVVDIDHPHVEALATYHRTRWEAEQRVEWSELHRGNEVIPGSDYLLIIEVERDSRPCVVCGEEVTAKDPDAYPYCRSCHYNGRANEDRRADQLHYFANALGTFDVSVEHTGGGCFWLAFYPGPYEVDGVVQPFYAATDGNAGVPEDDDGNPVRGGWHFLCFYGDYDNDPDGEMLIDRDEETPATDEELVKAILDHRRRLGV